MDREERQSFAARPEKAIEPLDREKWLRENREAIEAYNERVKRDGVFGEAFRRF
ncbi:MAG: type II toxin-antitoxin system CcdA family antitoxin [Sphingomonadales bacterium]|nr:type II toxin-antitoxin system CcdA family antitoxin [Sphingomonadales bacterium]